MILNSSIFTATVETAKAKAAGRADVLRAIDRAVVEIQKAAYWSFADGIFTVKSTTSGELYRVDADHTCPARSKVCKHHIARLLMIRYYERLKAADAAVAEANERAEMIARISAAWSKYTCHQIGDGLIRRFGVNQLEMLQVHELKSIAAVLR